MRWGILNKSIYETWGGHPVKLTWIPSIQLPEQQKITSVHGFCFDQDKVLLVHIPKRGFNTPGGHVETGESPEDTF
jgi:8-oxo-dGTP diphosphatase